MKRNSDNSATSDNVWNRFSSQYRWWQSPDPVATGSALHAIFYARRDVYVQSARSAVSRWTLHLLQTSVCCFDPLDPHPPACARRSKTQCRAAPSCPSVERWSLLSSGLLIAVDQRATQRGRRRRDLPPPVFHDDVAGACTDARLGTARLGEPPKVEGKPGVNY